MPRLLPLMACIPRGGAALSGNGRRSIGAASKHRSRSTTQSNAENKARKSGRIFQLPGFRGAQIGFV